jgi:hypothetical protein
MAALQTKAASNPDSRSPPLHTAGHQPLFPASGPATGSFNGPHPKSKFLAFNGAVTHVSNVNVQKMPDGSLHMLSTPWPDANKMNKPICFFSPDGKTWNGSPEPYRAAHQPNATPQPKNAVGT